MAFECEERGKFLLWGLKEEGYNYGSVFWAGFDGGEEANNLTGQQIIDQNVFRDLFKRAHFGEFCAYIIIF